MMRLESRTLVHMPPLTLSRSLAALGVAVAAVAVAAAVVAVVVGPSQFASVAPDLLPDLRMARLADLQLETGDDGERRLRFTAVIVNVGAGPMEVIGINRDGEIESVVQRIHQPGGATPREVPTDAQFYFAGDGHRHWHIRDMQAYRLERQGGGEAGVNEKHGFCLWDNERFAPDPPGAPETRAFSCPESRGDGEVRMGLSVGWRDVYPASLPDQFIDVTGLDSGRYRLWAESDPASSDRPGGWFVESDEANNLTWADLEIDFEAGSVVVVGYGPSA